MIREEIKVELMSEEEYHSIEIFGKMTLWIGSVILTGIGVIVIVS